MRLCTASLKADRQSLRQCLHNASVFLHLPLQALADEKAASAASATAAAAQLQAAQQSAGAQAADLSGQMATLRPQLEGARATCDALLKVQCTVLTCISVLQCTANLWV